MQIFELRGYATALIGGAAITIAAGLLVGSLIDQGAVRFSLAAEKNPGGTSFLEPHGEVMDIGVQVLSLDTDGQFARVLYALQPGESLGTTDWYENRVVINQPIKLTVGSVGHDQESSPVRYFPEGPVTGAVESLNAYDASVSDEAYIRDYDGLPNDNSADVAGVLGIAAKSYPFDEYLIDIGTTVATQAGDQEWQPVPSSAYFVGTGLPGMVVSVDRIPFYSDAEGVCSKGQRACDFASDWEAGLSRIQLEVSRSTLTKGIGLFGFFLTAICAMNSVALTLMVLFRKRPASLNVIALHAAVLFSLPAIRASIPGAPKLGITLDAVAFFPAIVIVVASLIVSSILWSTRSDAVSQ